jgi:hypothetical protein
VLAHHSVDVEAAKLASLFRSRALAPAALERTAHALD